MEVLFYIVGLELFLFCGFGYATVVGKCADYAYAHDFSNFAHFTVVLGLVHGALLGIVVYAWGWLAIGEVLFETT